MNDEQEETECPAASQSTEVDDRAEKLVQDVYAAFARAGAVSEQGRGFSNFVLSQEEQESEEPSGAQLEMCGEEKESLAARGYMPGKFLGRGRHGRVFLCYAGRRAAAGSARIREFLKSEEEIFEVVF